MQGIGAGGEVPILLAKVDSLQFAEIEVKDVQATVLKLKGMDKKFQRKFYGCIGFDLLKEFKV